MRNINKNVILVVFASVMAAALLVSLFIAVYLNASYANAQFYSSEIRNAAVRCQAHQDAFMHTKRIEDVDAFLHSYDDLIHNLELLAAESNVLSEGEVLATQMKVTDYRNLFIDYKEKQMIIGLTATFGERESLQLSVLSVEDTFVKTNKHRLLAMLYDCHRSEGSFIIHKKIKYVDAFHKKYNLLIRTVNESKLDSHLKGRVLAQLNHYQSIFNMLVEQMKEVGLNPGDGIRGQLQKALLSINKEVLNVQDTVLKHLGQTTRTIYLVLCISSLLILMVLFLGVRLIRFNLRLVSEVHKRKIVEEELAEVNVNLEKIVHSRTKKIASQIKDQERINKEIMTLNEFGDYLQRCHSTDEALYIVRDYAKRLFPHDVGALYLFDSDRSALELKVDWGESDGLFKDHFAPEECWGSRMDKVHYVGRGSQGLHCDHFNKELTTCYICVPMHSQEELVGVMIVVCNLPECVADNKMMVCTGAQRQRLVITITEHCSLALSNIQLRENLREQSIRDPLTGLHNRRYMLESLTREVSRVKRRSESLAALVIDIDYFKRFNDTYGHEMGDSVLKRVSEILLSQVREEDILCRMGGEEFLVIMTSVNRDITLGRAEDIRLAFENAQMNVGQSKTESLAVSIGIAFFPEHSSDINIVLDLADKALYSAKKTGRNKIVVFNEIMPDGDFVNPS